MEYHGVFQNAILCHYAAIIVKNRKPCFLIAEKLFYVLWLFQSLQVALPENLRQQLQAHIAKLTPEQQDIFKKQLPAILLRLQQQQQQQQQGKPATGVTAGQAQVTN